LYKSQKDILNDLDFIKSSTLVDLEIIPFKKATDWLFDPVSQNYRHKNGSFFSIDGINFSRYRTSKLFHLMPHLVARMGM
jgi:hypothetical protein